MITPPLGQTQKDQIILDGVTRRSVLDLAKERLSVNWSDGNQSIEGLEVVEKPFRLRDVELAATEGRLVEAFVTGTAVNLPCLQYSSQFPRTKPIERCLAG